MRLRSRVAENLCAHSLVVPVWLRISRAEEPFSN